MTHVSIKPCKTCGADFTYDPLGAGARKYCSKRCRPSQAPRPARTLEDYDSQPIPRVLKKSRSFDLRPANLPGEVWRPVLHTHPYDDNTSFRFKGACRETPWYEVSNMGRVRRCAPGKGTSVGRVLRPNWPHGRPQVNLPSPDGYVFIQVNKLVARAFVPMPTGHPLNQVTHLNGDTTDCRAANLAWAKQEAPVQPGTEAPTPPAAPEGHPVMPSAALTPPTEERQPGSTGT